MFGQTKFSKWYTPAALVAVLMLGSAGIAMAQEDDQGDAPEAAAVAAAKVRLGDAIRAAETQTGGTAMEAVYGNENGRLQVEVTVLGKDGKESLAKIDAASGKLLAVTGADRGQHEERGNREEEHED